MAEVEGNKKVGGCHNGGEIISKNSNETLRNSVPGGPRNCVRCRWFVTSPGYLPSLVARWNRISYYLEEGLLEAQKREQACLKLEEERFDTTSSGNPWERANDLRQAERLRENALGEVNVLAENLVACWRLIERCLEVAKGNGPSQGSGLVAVGTAMDVMAAFEETDSELLQLSGVCDDLELYPETEIGGKAVIRRGQLLDAFLTREGKSPLFLHLTGEEQLLVGNEFMHGMAKAMNPGNPREGRQEVVNLIDGGRHLADRLGMDLDEFLPRTEKGATPMVINFNEIKGNSNALHDRNPS